MESLSEETWDLVIAGTSLSQALLALSLSRSDLKILHVDKNSYYGGIDAGVSLDEAQAWTAEHQSPSTEQSQESSGIFSSARVFQPPTSQSKLAASRAYTLSLNPQIVYAQSTFLPSLVSSCTNTQLEFLAVGSWWICKNGKLQKVPSSREDVFADDELSRRDKIGLMKFLRSVMQEQNEHMETEELDVEPDTSLQDALNSRFRISPHLQLPISSLALSRETLQETRYLTAVSRIKRHMKSIGYFGPGFGAVIAKYAGNAEIAQVGCRACAVGGATYLLGHGLSNIVSDESDSETVTVQLSSDISVRARRVVGSCNDLPAQSLGKLQPKTSLQQRICHSINIVSSPLRFIFPQTSENGPVPAAAIVLVTNAEDNGDGPSPKPPIYLQIHSEDTGECPSGQSIVYVSTLIRDEDELSTTNRLKSAVDQFLGSASHEVVTSDDAPASIPEILWSMSYTSAGSSSSDGGSPQLFSQDDTGRVIALPLGTQDIAFNDDLLLSVKAVWRNIVGEDVDDGEFLRFKERGQTEEGDGDEQ